MGLRRISCQPFPCAPYGIQLPPMVALRQHGACVFEANSACGDHQPYGDIV